MTDTREQQRLAEAREQAVPWKRWGPYLSERQWGTVREDYSADGNAWDYFTPRPGALARLPLGRGRSRRHLRRQAAAVLRARALERQRPDPQGAAVRPDQQRRQSRRGREGVLLLPRQHAHPLVHEVPLQVSAAAYPYADLVETNRRARRARARVRAARYRRVRRRPLFRRRSSSTRRPSPEDILIRITVANRGPEPATLHVLPTLWFRNTWTWCARRAEAAAAKRAGSATGASVIGLARRSSATRWLSCDGAAPLLFTENETNNERLFGKPNATPYVKDGINDYVVHRRSRRRSTQADRHQGGGALSASTVAAGRDGA